MSVEMSNKINCFKAYDVRGQVPNQLNEDIAYRIGRAFVVLLRAKTVVVGHDMRLTSPAITNALINGLTDTGADVLHIGQCGTEEVYFATFNNKVDGGICVTASHNPINYNGMKFVREDAKPISADTGLLEIKSLAEKNNFPNLNYKGSVFPLYNRPVYIEHLLQYIDKTQLKPLKIVSNPGNGGAWLAINYLEKLLPLEFVHIHHQPDGNFPNGIPNPLEISNRRATIEAVKVHNADLGIAWDGDFDRCFFFDENGRFIESYYIIGILAKHFLLKSKNTGAKVVYDPRLTWNTQYLIQDAGGIAIQNKTGHTFIKERMRLEDAIYGGEMSGHHYFRDFAYCDSGMIPWLLIVELLSKTGKNLSQLVDDRMKAFPCSGEINSVVDDAKSLLMVIESHYASSAINIDHTDGLSMEFSRWRFNMRISNTESILRLNVESHADEILMTEKKNELLSMIKAA